MNISCPRCRRLAEPAGHEDARAFFQCPTCGRVWAAHISSTLARQTMKATVPRVLVADDSTEMVGLLSAWLEDEGCVVMAAGTGREALDACLAYRPDVAFLDVVLPPPDGFLLCEILTRRPGPAVVLMTGLSSPDRRRAMDAGAVALLQKPFSREAIVDALTTAMAQHRRDNPPEGAALASR